MKPDVPLVILHLPVDCTALFGDADYRTTRPRSGKIAQLIFFARNAAAIRDQLVPLLTRLSSDPLVWVMYPKKSGNITSDLSMTHGWTPVFDAGMTGVTSAAINDNWSALRVRPESLVKNALAPIAERSNEFVDYVSRTVTLPPDAARVVRDTPGMTSFFDALAFTHKKEHVEAILQAKKPETRARRIERMTTMLQSQMVSRKEQLAKK